MWSRSRRLRRALSGLLVWRAMFHSEPRQAKAARRNSGVRGSSRDEERASHAPKALEPS